MRQVVFFVLCILLTSFSYGQRKFSRELILDGKKKLHFNLYAADSVHITTGANKTLLVNASININQNNSNDNYTISIDENDTSILITANVDSALHNKPVLTSIIWQIQVPTDIDCKIKTINADVILNEIPRSVQVNSTTGDIELSIKKSSQLTFSLTSIIGKIYANNDSFRAIRNQSPKSYEVAGVYNGGGNMATLQSISGNIYLRNKD